MKFNCNTCGSLLCFFLFFWYLITHETPDQSDDSLYSIEKKFLYAKCGELVILGGLGYWKWAPFSDFFFLCVKYLIYLPQIVRIFVFICYVPGKAGRGCLCHPLCLGSWTMIWKVVPQYAYNLSRKNMVLPICTLLRTIIHSIKSHSTCFWCIQLRYYPFQ